MPTIIIDVELTEDQAWCLAQYLKRIGYSHYRALAARDDEAQTMQEAGERVRQALAEQGYAPR